MKTLQESKIGDTLYSIKTPKSQIPPFPGFQIPTPMVFAGIYPEEEEGFKDLESSIHKLLLTDTSIEIRGQHSQALGPGFRCGFLGVLHLEIFKDRLAAEYGVGALITRPNTAYRVVLKKGGYLEVHTPQDVEGILGDQILCWEEILAHATIVPLSCKLFLTQQIIIYINYYLHKLLYHPLCSKYYIETILLNLVNK